MATTLKLLFFSLILISLNVSNADEVFTETTAQLAAKQFVIEVADSPAKRAQGLMHRRAMPPDRGMLFVFDFEQTLTFWMKNTYIPLSIGFFDSNFRLFEVLDMQPESVAVKELPRYTSQKPARFALEMNKGWFAKNKIELGTQLRLTGKTLPESLKALKQKK